MRPGSQGTKEFFVKLSLGDLVTVHTINVKTIWSDDALNIVVAFLNNKEERTMPIVEDFKWLENFLHIIG